VLAAEDAPTLLAPGGYQAGRSGPRVTEAVESLA